jgi:hypothetical protein
LVEVVAGIGQSGVENAVGVREVGDVSGQDPTRSILFLSEHPRGNYKRKLLRLAGAGRIPFKPGVISHIAVFHDEWSGA